MLVEIRRLQGSEKNVTKVFGKNNRDVMRDIRGLIGQVEDVHKTAEMSMFTESTYINQQVWEKFPRSLCLKKRRTFTSKTGKLTLCTILTAMAFHFLHKDLTDERHGFNEISHSGSENYFVT